MLIQGFQEKRQARAMFRKEGEDAKGIRSATFTPGEPMATKRTPSADAIKVYSSIANLVGKSNLPFVLFYLGCHTERKKP